MSWSRRLMLAGALALATGCGFQPLYGERGGGGPGDELAVIEIGLIPDRVGQELRNVLLDRLSPDGVPKRARYLLEVRLTVSKERRGIRKDETATRANLRISAGFVLRRAADGAVLFRGVSQATTSFNIVTSEFATLSAEAAAQRRGVRVLGEDIQARLAAYFGRERETGT